MAETTVTFKLKDINSHLVCRLCNGYFRDAHTITECLHTFCKSCLFLEIAKGLTVCPHCKIDLSPHPRNRVLYDRTLQAIVDKIFPELEEQDRVQEEEFYAARGIKRKPEPESAAPMPSLATVSPTRDGAEDDADEGEEDDGSEEERSRAKRKRASNGSNGNRHDEEDDGSEADDDAGAESKHDDRHRTRKAAHPVQAKSPSSKQSHTQSAAAEEQQFDFKMLPDPTAAAHKQLPLLPKPFLRTKPTVKVAKVKKYLSKKLNIDSNVIEFLVKGNVVDNDMPLGQIMQLLWKDAGSSVIFHYRRQ